MSLVVTAFALTAQLAGFSGSWERNPEQSDDPEKKMQAVFEQMRAQREGRGARGGPPPEGGVPGESGAPRDHRMRGRSGGGPMGPMGMVTSADEIHVEFDRAELRVDDGQRLQIYYLDGQKHKRETPNGAELETTAELHGNTVSVREKMSRGEIHRSFELSPDEKTLIVSTTMDFKGLKEPVVVRSVYGRLPE